MGTLRLAHLQGGTVPRHLQWYVEALGRRLIIKGGRSWLFVFFNLCGLCVLPGDAVHEYKKAVGLVHQIR